MSGVRALLRALLRDDEAATLAEYALVLAVFSLGAIAALYAIGGNATDRLASEGDLLTQSGRNAP